MLDGDPNAVLGGSLVDNRAKISSSTFAFGRPYLAADNCFKALDSFSLGFPSVGSVAILKGCVGTPLINVLTMVLKFGTRSKSSPSNNG